MTPSRDEQDPAVCPVDVARPLMIQRWERLTFLHWRYDPAVVQRLVPAGLEVETYDGAAWVGLVPFYIRVRPPYVPWIPWAGEFCETNVRTYVRDGEGRSGVWFFSLDASRLAAVVAARTTYRLPYFWSKMRLSEILDRVEYVSLRRAPGARDLASRVVVERGDPIEAQSLTLLDHFLTARWNVFSVFANRYAFARACHPPWPLHRVEAVTIDDNLVAATGLPQPEGGPLMHYSPGVDVRIGRLQGTTPLDRPLR